jgi:hypothetical protein
MDTVSLPVYHRVRADLRLMLLVVALALTALVLLVAGGLDLGLLSYHQTDEPLMAPFRWWAPNAHVA